MFVPNQFWIEVRTRVCSLATRWAKKPVDPLAFCDFLCVSYTFLSEKGKVTHRLAEFLLRWITLTVGPVGFHDFHQFPWFPWMELSGWKNLQKKPLLIAFCGQFWVLCRARQRVGHFWVYVGPLGPCWAFGGPDFDFWHKTLKKTS